MHTTRSIRSSALLIALLLVVTCSASASAKAPVRCTVPKLSGVTLKVARQRLTHAHCAAGSVHRPKTASANLIVSRQSPKARAHRKHGAKVTLWLKVKPVKAATVTLTAPAVTPAPVPRYATKVDPTFVQSPTNPLAVTYSYSADATQTQGAQVQDLAQVDQLPAGILNFYNGGALACSTNVGGATSSASCSITYPATGSYQVTTQYIPTGATAVTETDTETINPVPTSTLLGASFGTPFSVTGPPPTYLSSTNWFDGFDAGYSQASAGSFTLTLTDQTTGVTQTGTSVPADGCAMEFVQILFSTTITIDPGCGLPGISFSDTNTVSVTATTPSAGGFLGSTSAPTEIWAG